LDDGESLVVLLFLDHVLEILKVVDDPTMAWAVTFFRIGEYLCLKGAGLFKLADPGVTHRELRHRVERDRMSVAQMPSSGLEKRNLCGLLRFLVTRPVVSLREPAGDLQGALISRTKLLSTALDERGPFARGFGLLGHGSMKPHGEHDKHGRKRWYDCKDPPPHGSPSDPVLHTSEHRPGTAGESGTSNVRIGNSQTSQPARSGSTARAHHPIGSAVCVCSCHLPLSENDRLRRSDPANGVQAVVNEPDCSVRP